MLCYDSPEKAFLNSGHRGTIKKVIDTENSSLVIFTNGSSEEYLLLSKEGEKWKAPLSYSNIYMKGVGNTIITAYGEKNSSNYYVILTVQNETSISITDSRNVIFTKYETSNHFGRYVTFVEDMESDYCVFIGDQKVPISLLFGIDL